MAAEVAVAREAAPTTKPVAAPVDENIPEIIEERRKDAEGRVSTSRPGLAATDGPRPVGQSDQSDVLVLRP